MILPYTELPDMAGGWPRPLLTWEADIGFCDPWPYSWGLLGQLSFFRFFTVVFRAADFQFELEPLAE